MWFLHLAEAAERKDLNVPQTFDWIFFAIMIPIPAFVYRNWLKNR